MATSPARENLNGRQASNQAVDRKAAEKAPKKCKAAPLAPTVPRLQLRSFVIGLAFVGISTSVGRTRQSKRAEFKAFLRKSPGDSRGLSKTLSTSRRKFRIGRLTSSILVSEDYKD